MSENFKTLTNYTKPNYTNRQLKIKGSRMCQTEYTCTSSLTFLCIEQNDLTHLSFVMFTFQHIFTRVDKCNY